MDRPLRQLNYVTRSIVSHILFSSSSIFFFFGRTISTGGGVTGPCRDPHPEERGQTTDSGNKKTVMLVQSTSEQENRGPLWKGGPLSCRRVSVSSLSLERLTQLKPSCEIGSPTGSSHKHGFCRRDRGGGV